MKFYLQQIGATVVIVGAWFLTIGLLVRPTRIPADDVPPVQKNRTKFEARDEHTGEVARVHHFDDSNVRTHVEVRFKDGVTGVIHYNLLGRITRVIEKKSDGSYQLFTFARNGRSVLKVQSFRKDDTLKSETTPIAEKQSIQIRRFGENGQTVVCDELIAQDGTFQSTTYHPGTTTAKLLYKRSADGLNYEVTAYSAAGLQERHEKVTEFPIRGGFGPFGMLMAMKMRYKLRHFEVTHFAADGKTIRLQQKWESRGNTLSLVEAQEFQADGKTQARRLERFESPAQPVVIGAPMQVAFKLHLFDAKGEALAARFLSKDHVLIREEVQDQPTCTAGGSKEPIDNLVTPPITRELTSIVPSTTPKLEPNHLQQMLNE